ncbi:terminase [Microbacterium phage FuzzBuster]|uniref:Terminase n=1 Tax=Microbacterium phage FuzzBuster TaxID=2590935 RepID=A0A516KUX6_9CAUD|nr:terminase [Microbacterium phage FuzzBuster]
MTDPDAELLAELMLVSDEELFDIVSTMPDADVSALLGWEAVGAKDAESMPSSPVAQATELESAYQVVPHVQYLSDRLTKAVTDVERGISRKLLVSMPPRHGKTEQISVYLPVWLLRRNHKAKIGIISHSPTLATVWGRRIRRLVERHGPKLGLSIAPDAGAVGEWETPEGGGVTSRSIGQALAGVGFNVLIIDDPTRDFAAAHSAPARQSVWDWWTANAMTRLEPPSLVIVVQTRWHEDDLTGRLLSHEHEGDPGEWEQIIIPAIAGPNDILGRREGEPLLSPLIPGETQEEALARFAEIKRNVGSYAWAALYQQSPAPSQGAIFNVGWWRYWTTDPGKVTDDGKVVLLTQEMLRLGRIITSWDATFKDTASSDYVVGQRWARIGANRFLLDQSRDRRSFTATVAEMTRFAEQGFGHEFAHEHLVEDKANGPAIIDTLRDKVSGLKPVNPRGSKEARARAITPEIESGNVYLPLPPEKGDKAHPLAWVNDFLDEARSFPTGEHDDQIDSATQALDELRTQGGAHISNPATAGRTTAGGTQRTSRASALTSRTIARRPNR